MNKAANVEKMVSELNDVLQKCDDVLSEITADIRFDTKNFRKLVNFDTFKKTENFYEVIREVSEYISYNTRLISIINLLSITLKELRLTPQFKEFIVRMYGEQIKNKVNYKIDNLEMMKEIIVGEKENADKQYKLYSTLLFAHTNHVLKGENY